MKEIIVVIEASKDGFGAYAENVFGLYGAGSTIEECKNSFLEAIEIYKEPDMIDSAPKCIVNGDCEIIYKYVGCGELVVNVDWVEENYCAIVDDSILDGVVVVTEKDYEKLKLSVAESIDFHVKGLIDGGGVVPEWLREKKYALNFVNRFWW